MIAKNLLTYTEYVNLLLDGY